MGFEDKGCVYFNDVLSNFIVKDIFQCLLHTKHILPQLFCTPLRQHRIYPSVDVILSPASFCAIILH